MVTAVSIAKDREQRFGELDSFGAMSQQYRWFSVKEIHPWIPAIEQPLSEIEKARHSTGAVAGEDLGWARGSGVRTVRCGATQTENTTWAADSVSDKQLADAIRKRLGYRRSFAGWPTTLTAGGNSNSQLDLIPPIPE